MGDIDWEEARAWLSELGVYPFGGTTLFDFAASLRDGSVLCDAANKIRANIIPSIHRNPGRQFLCFQNINAFLAVCRDEFGLPNDKLFESEDLFHASEFSKVVSCISNLSKIPEAQKLASPFPKDTGRQLKEDIYGGLESLMSKRNNSRARRISGSEPTSSAPAAGVLVVGGLGTSSTTEDGDDDEATPDDDEGMFQENYDDLLDMVKEDIYGEVCGVKNRSKSTKPAANEKRKYIFQELLETERSYVEALVLINESFRVPLTKDQARVGLSAQDLRRIFMNVELLLDLHKRFLSRLEQGQDAGVSTAFLETKADFLAYAEYVAHLAPAIAHLEQCMQTRSSFAVSLDALQRQSKQKFFLKDLLSVPMQRILKYPLLLKDLISSCKKFDEKDVPDLTRALRAMQDLAKHINESKRDSDSLEVIKDIQAGLRDYEIGSPGVVPLRDFGRFVQDGDMKIKMDYDGKIAKRYAFLFQKALLICKPRGMYYHFCYTMNTKDFSLEDEWVKGRNIGIKMVSKHPSAMSFNCTLLLKNEENKLEWLDQLSQAKYDVTAKLPDVVGTPHNFNIHTFSQARTCDHCDFLLWGLLNQGFLCEGCKHAVHKGCLKKIDARCPGTSRAAVRIPLSSAGTMRRNPIETGTATLRRGRARLDEPLPRIPVDTTPRPTPAATAPPSDSNTPEVFVAVHSFVNHKDKSSGDLTFHKGDQLTIIDKTSPHWWQAKDISGQIGMVPASFIVPLGEEHLVMPRSKTFSSKPRHHRPLAPPTDAPPPSSAAPAAQPNFAGQEMYGVESQAKPIRPVDEPLPTLPQDDTPPARPSPARAMTIATTRVRRSQPFVQSADIGKELADAPWYAGTMSREDADGRLQDEEDGSYLVRESTNRCGEFTLSVKFGLVKHIRILLEQGEYYISRRLHFASIPQLIAHYQAFSLAASYKDIKTPLIKPLGAIAPPRPPKSAGLTATAQFDFDAGTADELSFKAGQKIAVLSQEGCGQGWWKGQIGPVIGVFPANYVRLD